MRNAVLKYNKHVGKKLAPRCQFNVSNMGGLDRGRNNKGQQLLYMHNEVHMPLSKKDQRSSLDHYCNKSETCPQCPIKSFKDPCNMVLERKIFSVSKRGPFFFFFWLSQFDLYVHSSEVYLGSSFEHLSRSYVPNASHQISRLHVSQFWRRKIS